MSVKAVEWAFRQEVSTTAKLVLLMLCDCINVNDEFAFPRQERIASTTRMSTRQVRRHIDTLVAANLIRVTPGAGKGHGKGREPDKYRFACDHITGEDRPFARLTGGHGCPIVSPLTGGHELPPVPLTGGHERHLQADMGVRFHIDEPEEEPELSLREREANPPLKPSGKPMAPASKLDGKRAIELYNEAAARRGWCLAKGAPSAQRKAMVAARLREHGMEGWIEQIALAERMPFLRGDNDRGWRMGIDYFARPSGWAKIAEGGFRTEGGAKGKPRFSADNPPPGCRFAGYGEDGGARYTKDLSRNFYR